MSLADVIGIDPSLHTESSPGPTGSFFHTDGFRCGTQGLPGSDGPDRLKSKINR